MRGHLYTKDGGLMVRVRGLVSRLSTTGGHVGAKVTVAFSLFLCAGPVGFDSLRHFQNRGEGCKLWEECRLPNFVSGMSIFK